MSIPDCRIRLPAAKIDFDADVGTTGQAHDDFPAPGAQARYDHFRSFLIGLLAQQASEEEPTQYRNGTSWFDLTTNTLKIRSGDEWVSLAEAISLTEPDTDGAVVTLASWYESLQALLTGLSPEIVFSGSCSVDDVTTITIPESVQSSIHTDSRVFLYINGSLVDPRNCSVIGTTTIRLSNVVLMDGDVFTANIRRISASTFLASSVSVP
jgi:hypothetical protein